MSARMRSIAFALACAGADAKDAPVLSTHGYGAIVFGAKVSAVEATLKEKIPPPKDGEDAGCRFVAFKAYPGMQFMVEKGVITRADVDENAGGPGAKVATELGVTIGAVFGDLPHKFPTLEQTPNPYDEAEHNWVYPRADGRGALIVIEYKGKVRSVYAGVEPAVYYDEGCS